MNKRLSALRDATIAASILAASLFAPVPAFAQDPSLMSCNELWYARNEIYARNGFCFKTERAQSVFGPGCFPPFGKLTNADARTVSTLQSWEKRRKCPG
jgi:hypothetical protein